MHPVKKTDSLDRMEAELRVLANRLTVWRLETNPKSRWVEVSNSDDRGADADPEARDRELALREQRRNAVGSEMESVLSVLGGVSSASERSGFWAC